MRMLSDTVAAIRASGGRANKDSMGRLLDSAERDGFHSTKFKRPKEPAYSLAPSPAERHPHNRKCEFFESALR